MALRMDDLTDVLAPPPPPSGNTSFRRGTVVAFNALTGQNTIRVAGVDFTDLTMLNATEQALMRPGAEVAILAAGGSEPGGAQTYFILGVLAVPQGTGWMSGPTSAEVLTQEATGTTTYTNLATTGPAVTVWVGPSGKVEVIITCRMGWSRAAFNTFLGGAMSFELSGANTLAASDKYSITNYINISAATDASKHQAGASYVLSGLNPGSTTFTAKYRKIPADVNNPDFADRIITVRPL